MGDVYEPRSGCPINATIEVFGDRWSLLVLRDIVFGDRRYFRELQAGSQEGIASNILADRLKRLVELGLLTREDTRAGQRARYSLTEPAIQLVPVFAQLGSWGLRHRPTSRAARSRRAARTRRPRALAGAHGRTAPLAVTGPSAGRCLTCRGRPGAVFDRRELGVAGCGDLTPWL